MSDISLPAHLQWALLSHWPSLGLYLGWELAIKPGVLEKQADLWK